MDYAAIAVAGFLGAAARALVGKVIVTGFHPSFPFHTLAINLTGCLVLAFFMKITIDRLQLSPSLRLGIGTGFFGAFTTFSTFTTEALTLLREGSALASLIYMLVTPLGCLFFAWLGSVLAKAVTQRPAETPEISEKK